MNPLQRLFGYARPYRGRFAVALAAMVVYAAATAAVADLIQPVIDEVLPTGAAAARPGASRCCVVYAVKGIGGYVSTYVMTDIGQRVVRDLRDRLFRHILDQSAAFFSRHTTGRLMSRITNDVNQVQQAVSETIGDLMREGLSVVGIVAYMFYVDARLALVAVTGAPLVVYPLVKFGKRIRSTTRKSQEELEHLSHVTAEAFTGHRIVKAFGAEAHEEQRFRRASQRLYRTNLKVTRALAILPPLMELLGGLAIVGLVWYGSHQITVERTLTQGEFTSFLAAAFMMYAPMKKLSRVNASLQQAMAASERIFEILDTHSEVKERPGALPLPQAASGHRVPERQLHVRRCGEEHPSRRLVPRSGPARRWRLSGLSGAGKTTLVNLVPRFYDVTGGQHSRSTAPTSAT